MSTRYLQSDALLVQEEGYHDSIDPTGCEVEDEHFHPFDTPLNASTISTRPSSKDTKMTDVENTSTNGRLRPRRKPSTNNQSTRSLRKSESKLTDNTAKECSTSSQTTPFAQTSSEAIPPSDKSKPPAQLFLCLYCERSFPSKKSLSKHVQRIHNASARREFTIKCAFCSHTETDTANFVNHMLESHPNEYFACGSCIQRFPSSKELNNHFLGTCRGKQQRQAQPYRNKLRHKNSVTSLTSTEKVKTSKQFDVTDGEPLLPPDLNDVVVSCELNIKKGDVDFEESISMNLILPPCKTLCAGDIHDKRAVIVLDDIQWKRKPTNINAIQGGDRADQILSRLGVIHRSRGTETSRYWYRHIDESAKFERCFDTNFYLKVANNVQNNLLKFLDGAFDATPRDGDQIKTRKSKNNVIINTIEGFPTLLAIGQFSRNTIDDLPRAIAPKQKWKWDNTENDKQTATNDDLGIIKLDSHKTKCIVSLFSSLDIWTQLRMRQKYEKTFTGPRAFEKPNASSKELKQIIESRELPHTSTQIVKYTSRPSYSSEGVGFPMSLGLVPAAPECEMEPAVLSGEWARKRCYVCCACGQQSQDPKSLSTHYSTHHPQAQVNHYEIVGEELLNADILQHLYVPPAQLMCRSMRRRFRGAKTCTKCHRHFMPEDLHEHILECAGDTPVPRRKVRYRPFGVRRRRTRMPEKAIRKQLRKNLKNRRTRQKKLMRTRPRIRSDVGDAETIKKMIADLPAKRHRVSASQVNSSVRPASRREKQIQMRMKRRQSENDGARSQLKASCNADQHGKATRSKLTPKDTNVKDERSKSKITQNLCAKGKVLKVKITRKTVVRKSGRKNHEKLHNRMTPSNAETSISNTPPVEASSSEETLNLLSGVLDTSETNIEKLARSSSGGNGTSNSRIGGSSNEDNSQSGRNNSQNPNGPKNAIPLKHSIASLTANSHGDTFRKHPLVATQQNVESSLDAPTNNSHPYDGQRMLPPDEVYARKLDKPPLCAKTDDACGASKSKLNKPRRGLNDCIAMLKGKLDGSPVRNPNENTVKPDLINSRDNPTKSCCPLLDEDLTSPNTSGRIMTQINTNIYPPAMDTIEFGSAPMLPLDLSGKSSHTTSESVPITISLSSPPTPLCLAPIQSEPLPLVTAPTKSLQPPITTLSLHSASSQFHSLVSQVHTAAPQANTATPQVQIAVKQVHSAAPQVHTALPQMYTAAPQVHTAVHAPVAAISRLITPPLQAVHSVLPPAVHLNATTLAHPVPASGRHSVSPTSVKSLTPPMMYATAPSVHPSAVTTTHTIAATAILSVAPPSVQETSSSVHTVVPSGVHTVASPTVHTGASTYGHSLIPSAVQVTPVYSGATPTSPLGPPPASSPPTVSVTIIPAMRMSASTGPGVVTGTAPKKSSDPRRSSEKSSPKGNQMRSMEKLSNQRPVFDPTLRIPQYKVRHNTHENEQKESPTNKIQSEPNRPSPTESTVALLPKEIVEILGTMSTQDRNTLLNALPQVFAKTVKDLKLVVDSNVSKESLTSPNKFEIATQTINSAPDHECPPEFVNIDTDKFLIDPVTGTITERPSKEVSFSVAPEIRPIIMELPRLDVIDLTTEEEEHEKKATSNEGSIFLPPNVPKIPEPDKMLAANLSGVASNIQPLVHIPSPVKCKGPNEKTASLRAVRIKSANEKQKILAASESITPTISKPSEQIEINKIVLETNNPPSTTCLTLETTESGLNTGSMTSPAIQQAEISSTQQSSINAAKLNQHCIGSHMPSISPTEKNTSTLKENNVLPNEKMAEKMDDPSIAISPENVCDIPLPQSKVSGVPKDETMSKEDEDITKVNNFVPITEPNTVGSYLPISSQNSIETTHLTEKPSFLPVDNLDAAKESAQLPFEEKPEISCKLCDQKVEQNETDSFTQTMEASNASNVVKDTAHLTDEDDPEDDVSLAVIVKQKLLKVSSRKGAKKKNSQKKSKKGTKENNVLSNLTDACTNKVTSQEIPEIKALHNDLTTSPDHSKTHKNNLQLEHTESAQGLESEIQAETKGKKVTIKAQIGGQTKKDILLDSSADLVKEYTNTPSSSPLPLRRSRRRKSVVIDNLSNDTPESVTIPDTGPVQNKLPLTKKQLIFSKLLDEKKSQDLKLKDLANPKSVNVIDSDTFHGELVLECENAQKSANVSQNNKTNLNDMYPHDSTIQESKKRKREVIKRSSKNNDTPEVTNKIYKNEIFKTPQNIADISVNQSSDIISSEIDVHDSKSTEDHTLVSTINEDSIGVNIAKEINEISDTITLHNHISITHETHSSFQDLVSDPKPQEHNKQNKLSIDNTVRKTKTKKGKKKYKVSEDEIVSRKIDSPVTSSTDVGELLRNNNYSTTNDKAGGDIDVTKKTYVSDNYAFPSEQKNYPCAVESVPTEMDSIMEDIIPAKKRKKRSSSLRRSTKNSIVKIMENVDETLHENNEKSHSVNMINHPSDSDTTLTYQVEKLEFPSTVLVNKDFAEPNESKEKNILVTFLNKKCELAESMDGEDLIKANESHNAVQEVIEIDHFSLPEPTEKTVADKCDATEQVLKNQDNFDISTLENDNIKYNLQSKKKKKSNLKRKSSPSNHRKQKSKKNEILDGSFGVTEDAQTEVVLLEAQPELAVFTNTQTHIPETILNKESTVDVDKDYLYGSELTNEMTYATRRTRSKSVMFKTVTATSPQDFDILGPVCDNVEFTNNNVTADDKSKEAAPFVEPVASEANSLENLTKITKSLKKISKKSKIKKEKGKKQKHSRDIMEDLGKATESELFKEQLSEEPPSDRNIDTKVENKPSVELKKTEDFNDSDDSSKSDVPLNKYVKDVLKNSSSKAEVAESIIKIKGKAGPSAFIKNRRKTIATCSNTSTKAPETAEEQTKSDQFMASFGFFSERKPRKSNLLAAKKIFETFHLTGNESDDVSYRDSDRVTRRNPSRENKPIPENTANPTPSTSRDIHTSEPEAPSTKKKSVKEDGKSKSKGESYCSICKKQFRRPDNLTRHLLTLLHVSNLSAIEQNLEPNTRDEPPNCLVVYRRHLENLKRMQQREGITRRELPTLSEMLQMTLPLQVSGRDLSRDEALFYECCELLKESHKNKRLEPQAGTSGVQTQQPAQNSFVIVTQPATVSTSPVPSTSTAVPSTSSAVPSTSTAVPSTSFSPTPPTPSAGPALETDEDVDSITAKEIMESEEVRSLENDLISGLKKVSNINTYNEETLSSIPDNAPQSGPYDFTSDDETKMAEIRISRYNSEKAHSSTANSNNETEKSGKSSSEREREAALRREMERLQALPSTSTGIYHATDLFEDKFDKIKRKCRSQAAAAKNAHLSLESSSREKPRKKNEKKSGQKKRSRKLQCTVPTKGALKGFDGIKVSIPTSDIKLPSTVPSVTDETPKKRKKKVRSRKLFELDTDSPSTIVPKLYSSGITPKNKVDVYEFMDDAEDTDTFEFRPTTLSERIKSAIKSHSLNHGVSMSDAKDAEDSGGSVSDGDDFVYMSDDYLCSANETETENSLMSCELGNGSKSLADTKKFSSTKRKDSTEKSTVMGKIFKNNAVRNERRDCSRDSAFESPDKTNLDQLFDSLLEKGPESYMEEKEEGSSRESCERERERSPTPASALPFPIELLEQVSDGEGGVARQRARRKCTVGKQNILAETWSSESDQELVYGRRPNSVESTASAARKKKSRKASSMVSGARDPRKPRHITFKEDEEGRGGAGPRPGLSYYCAEEQQEGSRSLVEQHGWIVGDSHKKLVTMLAHAKGRKRDDKRHFLE